MFGELQQVSLEARFLPAHPRRHGSWRWLTDAVGREADGEAFWLLGVLVRARTLQSGWRRCHRPHKSEALTVRQERRVACLTGPGERKRRASILVPSTKRAWKSLGWVRVWARGAHKSLWRKRVGARVYVSMYTEVKITPGSHPQCNPPSFSS